APEGGPMMTFESIYRDILPQQRIVYTSTMSAGNELMTVSLTTVEFRPAEGGTSEGGNPEGGNPEGGTRLVLTEQGRSWTAGRNRPGGSTAPPSNSMPWARSSPAMADLQAEIQAAADEMVASGAETGRSCATARPPPAWPRSPGSPGSWQKNS
ncbi:MAG: hypothetical protein ACHP9Z_35080, partial [Streptosporangiales bacterium]